MADDGRDDDRDDPFDGFEGYEDREGDPFAHLGSSDADPPADADAPADHRSGEGGSVTDPQGTPTDTGGDTPREPDPFEYGDGDTGGYGGHSGAPADGQEGTAGESRTRATESGPDRSPGGTRDQSDWDADGDPEAGPFEDVDPSRGDPFEAGAGAFEQVDVDGVDPDDVWARFTDAEAATEPEPLPEGDEAGDDVEDEIVEVPKHSFCEGCEFFSPPPEVRCTHQGTSILEFVDMETVRVANCPVVDERRELGGFDAE